MNSEAARLDLTEHALQRIQERKVPPCILMRLRTDAPHFLGRHEYRGRIRIRIVRTFAVYWIAPYSDGAIVTIYAKDAREIDNWSRRYLINPRESAPRLHRLPIHRTASEAITAELSAQWALEA